MFGKILSISEKEIIVENILRKVESSLLGVHIVFENKNIKIIGEISNISETSISCNLIGEIIDNLFVYGIINKPSPTSTIRIIYKSEVPLLLGDQNPTSPVDFYVGKSVTYSDFSVNASINEFFSNHFAIIGNSGSGKSCSISSILQHLYSRSENVPLNSNIVIFDVYGEYAPAFQKLSSEGIIKVKYITTRCEGLHENEDLVRIPPYLLNVDDWALLLGADEPSQIAIIQKAIKYVKIFYSNEGGVREVKNSIIASSLIDILSSGKNPAQIRDQVIAVLTKFNTEEINVDSKIVQPGYIRTIKQCLSLDATGKINTIQLVVEYLSKFTILNENDVESAELVYYTLTDLYDAFEFALISEGVLKSDKVFEKNNSLKVRLGNIINSDDHYFFEYEDFVTRGAYIKRMFIDKNGEKAQIVNYNLNYIDERLAKVFTKIYSKMYFDYAISLEVKGSFPVQIVLEEAHRYVQNDKDVEIIGYNIFDRITKEGRKYGVILGLISQRPSEISNTALSQCSNFLIFRLFHPDDIRIVTSLSYNISDSMLARLKILRPGTALVFGTAFKISTLVKLDKPNPMPASTNVDIKKIWLAENRFK